MRPHPARVRETAIGRRARAARRETARGARRPRRWLLHPRSRGARCDAAPAATAPTCAPPRVLRRAEATGEDGQGGALPFAPLLARFFRRGARAGPSALFAARARTRTTQVARVCGVTPSHARRKRCGAAVRCRPLRRATDEARMRMRRDHRDRPAALASAGFSKRPIRRPGSAGIGVRRIAHSTREHKGGGPRQPRACRQLVGVQEAGERADGPRGPHGRHAHLRPSACDSRQNQGSSGPRASYGARAACCAAAPACPARAWPRRPREQGAPK